MKKEKKFYESPSMTVYEIGRTQILAGSPAGGNTNSFIYEDTEFDSWEQKTIEQ